MPFEKKETTIPGCFELIPKVHSDERGFLVKSFHEREFHDMGLATDFKEEFYSISKKGVLRGLHFQHPPANHIKLVSCLRGHVLDAVLDLRTASGSYGRSILLDLSEDIERILYIPSGCAHGFYSLTNGSLMLYRTTTVHSPDLDAGILWNSAGIKWPDISPVLSPRDLSFPVFSGFKSPF